MGAGSQASLELIIALKDQASDGMDKLAGKGNLLSNALSFAAGGAILGGVQAIAGEVGDFFKSSIAESQGWNDAMAQTDAVLKSTGGSAGVTKQQVEGLAASLSSASGLSKFADDAIASGENLLLTFTGIGKDVFPQATQTMLDMAQAMGGDMKGTAIQLGKALNDPAQGLSALTRVGVTFTQQQEDQIKAMVKAGDTAGAQKVMLAELSREFGGSATAAAEAAGPMFQLGAKFDDIKQTVGDALLPVINQLATTFGGLVSGAMPALQAAASQVGPAFATIGATIQGLITQAQPFIDFVGANLQPILTGLAAIIIAVAVPAFVAWAASAGAAAIATIAAMAPVLAPILAIGVAVAALKMAWDNNFLGMRDTLMPIIEAVTTALSTFWTEIQPKLIEAWNAISSTVGTAWQFIQRTILEGVAAVYNAWNSNWGGIRTIIESVWTIISTIVSTAWTLVSGIITTGVQLLSGDWSGAWETIKGTFQGVWDNIGTILGSAITLVGTVVTEFLPKLIGKLAEWGGAFLGFVAKDVLPQIPGKLMFLWFALQQFMHDTLPKIIEKIKEWAGAFLGFVGTEVIPKLAGALGAIKDKIFEWIGGAISAIATKAGEIGSGIVNGILQGLKNTWENIMAWIREKIAALPQFIKDFLGISSPSSVMVDIFENVALGMAEGVENKADAPTEAIRVLLEQLTGMVRSAMDKTNLEGIVAIWNAGLDHMFGHANNAWIPQTKNIFVQFFEDMTGYFVDYTQQWVQIWRDAMAAMTPPSAPGGGSGGGSGGGGGGGGGGGTDFLRDVMDSYRGSGSGGGGGRAQNVGLPGGPNRGGDSFQISLAVNVGAGANGDQIGREIVSVLSRELRSRTASRTRGR